MNNRTALSVAEKVAWASWGTPYKWGGDDPMGGFDCSGNTIEILKSPGKLPARGDWPAKGLFQIFKNKIVALPKKGCLVFWGKSEEGIYHVEFCLNDTVSIGASGGGSKTLTRIEAIAQNAYVKVRPIRGRGPVFAFVDPFKPAQTL